MRQASIALLSLLLVAPPTLHAQPRAEAPLIFEAVLRGENVAPAALQTNATAVAVALLIGDTLLVSGSFTDLSSAMRDVERTPNDPGVHIHPGAAGRTNPYIFGLRVAFHDDGRSGTFAGRFTLSAEQVRELRADRIYIDIHTMNNRPGEVRDQFRQRVVSRDEAEALAASFESNGTVASSSATVNAEHCLATVR